MIKIIFWILVFGLCSTLTLASEGFILNSIDEANQLSKLTDKPILLIFGADYCVHCIKLKEDILNSNISEDIDKMIICFIDIAKNPKEKIEYNIKVIPNSRIIYSNKSNNPIIGYNKDNYITWLKSYDKP